MNTEEIQDIKHSEAGEWKCVVRQQDLNFEWVTNWITVEGTIQQQTEGSINMGVTR